jgi:hypothetical protein
VQKTKFFGSISGHRAHSPSLFFLFSDPEYVQNSCTCTLGVERAARQKVFCADVRARQRARFRWLMRHGQFPLGIDSDTRAVASEPISKLSSVEKIEKSLAVVAVTTLVQIERALSLPLSFSKRTI